MVANFFITKDKSPHVGGRFVFFLFLTFIFASSNVWSDTIKLKSGKIVHGTIHERNARFVEVDVGLEFPITYYFDEIQEIMEEDQKKPSVNSSIASASKKVANKEVDEANQIEQQGLVMIDEGKMDEGLGLLRQALEMDSKASRHLSLGGILFGNGVALFKGGNKEGALKLFHDAEKEIQKAAVMFDPDEERTLLSQAYYLLGEMHANAFDNPAKAKEYYEKSLSLYAHSKAQQGLNVLK